MFQIFFKVVHPSFYSTPNKCLGTVFTFHVTQPKKKFPPSEVLIPIGWCDFTPVWQNITLIKACRTAALGVHNTS